MIKKCKKTPQINFLAMSDARISFSRPRGAVIGRNPVKP
jgi:hypothetical protein